eukprot:g8340.t1
MAMAEPLDVKAALGRMVIDPERPLAEVQAYTESRVPPMPNVRTVAEWEAHAKRMREETLKNVVFRGEAAKWRRQETKIVWLETIPGGEGYRIRKLRFEAVPGLWIPALLYEPTNLKGKVPVVMNVNGHDGKGKVAKYKQIRCINFAKRGMLALNVEWVGMGQLRTTNFSHYRMNQLDLCGTSGVSPFYLSMKRGIDVLLSHENADPSRVAVAGLSGGGWQTIFISSLDTRVTLSDPVAGYSSFRTRARFLSDLGDSEQTPVDLATTADYAQLTALRAPRPTLLTFNANDQCCFKAEHALPPLVEAARPIYKLYGKTDFLRTHVNHDPGSHNFEKDNRQQLYRMIGDHFYKGKSFDAKEIPCENELKTAEQLHVELPENNSDFHQLALKISQGLPRTPKAPTTLPAARTWQSGMRKKLNAVLRARRYGMQAVAESEKHYDGATVRSWWLRVGGSWTVPAVELFRGNPKQTTILLADGGRAAAAEQAEALLKAGHRVLAIDPFYFGESKISKRDFLYALLISAVGDRPLGIQAGQGPRLDRRRATFVDDEGEETDETGTSERADRPLRFFFERCVSDLREGGPWVMRLVSLVALAVLTDIVLWFTVGQSARMMPSGPARQLSATMQSDNLLFITLLIFNLLATPLQLALECVALGLALKTCSVIPPAKLDPLELVSDVMVTRLLGFCALFLLGLFVPVLMLLVLFGYPLLMYLFLPAWTTADRLEVSLSKSLAVSGMWFLYLIVSVIPMLLIAMADLLRLSTLAGLYVVLAAPFLILITAVVWITALLFCGTIGCAKKDDQAGGKQGGRPPTLVRVRQVERVDVAPKVIVVGTVKAKHKSVIASGANGVVDQYKVVEGQWVDVDDVLSVLRMETSRREVAEASNVEQERKQIWEDLVATRPDEIAEARFKMDAASRTYEAARRHEARMKKALERNAINEDQYEDAQERHKVAESMLKAATASYQRIKSGQPQKQAEFRFKAQQERVHYLLTEQAKRTTKAPFAGFVTHEHTYVGQWLSKGDPVATMAMLDEVDIVVNVDQKDLHHVHLGGKAEVEIAGYELTALTVNKKDKYVGIVRSENAETIRLETADGTIHPIATSSVTHREIRPWTGSIMQIVPKSEWESGSRGFPVKVRIKNRFRTVNAEPADSSSSTKKKSGEQKKPRKLPLLKEGMIATVRDKLNQVASYPENVDEPTITTVNPNANAIAWFILKPLPPTVADLKAFSEEHPHLKGQLQSMIDGKLPIEPSILAKWARKHPELQVLVVGKNAPAKMRKFARDEIEARFERVKGIANANVLGGQEQEFQIVVDPFKLAAHKLTIADLNRVLRAENRNTSGGDIREGKNNNVVRTIGLYDSPEKVAETVIAQRDTTPIRVRDIATVRISYTKPDGVVRQKGVDGLAINAQQSPGTNLIEIMGPPAGDLDLDGDGDVTQPELSQAKRIYGDSLRIAAAELNAGILKQKGLYLDQVYDQTDYLKSATALVENNIYIGGALAVLILLLFLRSPRSVLIVGLSIPISVVATFIFIRGFGRSINVISLAGMAFAVGMVVDNAIVVLENIFRHYQAGENPETASSRGAVEVWGAVLASTLTTLAVFIPVLFVEGQAGQLFRDIAIAISCAVGLSLIVSITVIPTAARRILKKRTEAERKAILDGTAPGRPGSRGEDTGRGFANRLAASIRFLLTMPFSVVVRLSVVCAFVVVSIYGAFLLAPKTEYLPDGNRNLVIAMLMPPPGYNVEQMIRLGEGIEPEIAPHWEAQPGSPEEAALEGPRIDNFFFVARGTRLFMGARSVDPLRAGELVPVMNRAVRKAPGVFAFATQASLFESALTGGRTIDIEITGPDLNVLVAQGRKAMGLCLQHFPPAEGNQIQPIPGLNLTSPELHVVANREKAGELGVTSEDLGFTVNALVDGAYAGDYWHEGRKIDLVIFGDEKLARHTHDVENLPIATPAGKVVTIGSIAEVKLSQGPDQIDHSERSRTVTLRLKPRQGMALETALEIVDEKIRKPLLETSAFEGGQYQIRLSGTADKLGDTRRALQWNLLLALVITYLLMAALFESFFYPLVIMTSVMLALVGGFGGLFILNQFIPQSLDMLTMLGFVILIGTVVNNAILIVHQALNYMREDGMDDRAAIVESVRTRIRPIFMSTTTTVLGMLPLVLPMPSWGGGEFRWAAGAGSELYRGLGSVVLGGLIVSTVFTLVLVPIGFSLALDVKQFLLRVIRRIKPTKTDDSSRGQGDVAETPAPVSAQEKLVTSSAGQAPD